MTTRDHYAFAYAFLFIGLTLAIYSLWTALTFDRDPWIRHEFTANGVEHRIAHHRNSVQCPICWPGQTLTEERN